MSTAINLSSFKEFFRHYKLFYLFLLLFSLITEEVTALESSSEEHLKPAPFVLGSGDLLRIFVWDHPSLSLKIPINPNGSVNYPLIWKINAAGLTETGLEEIISKKLAEHIKNPQVTVTLMEVQSFRIYVLGEVLRSGEFIVKGAPTVIQAIAMAGGFTPFASKKNILILDKLDGKINVFNFEEVVDQDSHRQDIFLQPGDTVIVK